MSDFTSRLLYEYRRAGNWLLPLLRQQRELARLPVVHIGACNVHFNLGGNERLAFFGVPARRETAWQRALRLALALHPLGLTFSAQPDATAGIDTYVRSGSPDNNYGTRTYLELYPVAGSNSEHVLIKDDLSSLAGTTITSATRTLTVVRQRGWGSTALKVHRIFATNAWTEDGATHNHANSATSTAWAGGAYGCGIAGTDYSNTAMGSVAVAQPAAGTQIQISYNTTEFAAMRSANYGEVYYDTDQSDADYYQVASSDHATASYRPQLVVEYTESSGSFVFPRRRVQKCLIVR